MTTKHTWTAVVVTALALGAWPLRAAETGAPIPARQHAMEGVREAMKVIGAMVRKQAPFDASLVHKNAGVMAANLKTAAALFPAGSDKGAVETWAKPEIWAEGSSFAKTLEDAQAAAVALQAVKDEAALGPALGALGQHCKSCHDQYRRPKD